MIPRPLLSTFLRSGSEADLGMRIYLQGIWRCFQERLERGSGRRGEGRERNEARMPSERNPSTRLIPRGALQRKPHLPADEEAGSSRSRAMKHPVSSQALAALCLGKQLQRLKGRRLLKKVTGKSHGKQSTRKPAGSPRWGTLDLNRASSVPTTGYWSMENKI